MPDSRFAAFTLLGDVSAIGPSRSTTTNVKTPEERALRVGCLLTCQVAPPLGGPVISARLSSQSPCPLHYLCKKNRGLCNIAHYVTIVERWQDTLQSAVISESSPIAGQEPTICCVFTYLKTFIYASDLKSSALRTRTGQLQRSHAASWGI